MDTMIRTRSNGPSIGQRIVNFFRNLFGAPQHNYIDPEWEVVEPTGNATRGQMDDSDVTPAPAPSTFLPDWAQPGPREEVAIEVEATVKTDAPALITEIYMEPGEATVVPGTGGHKAYTATRRGNVRIAVIVNNERDDSGRIRFRNSRGQTFWRFLVGDEKPYWQLY